MKKFLTDLEQARKMESYCGHDLRGELGRSISLLGLLYEATRQYGDLAEITEMALRSSQEALEELDRHLERNTLETRYVWIYGFAPQKDSSPLQLHPDGSNLLVQVPNYEDLVKRRKLYRPDVFIMNGDQKSAEELAALVKIVGSGFTKVWILRHRDAMALDEESLTGARLHFYERDPFENLSELLNEQQIGKSRSVTTDPSAG